MYPTLWDYLYLIMTITVTGAAIVAVIIGIQIIEEMRNQRGRSDD